MTSNEIALILRRLDEHGEHLRNIEGHVAKTNSRVSKLELWQAKIDGARMALAWIPSLAVGVTVGVTVALVTTLVV